jgi:diadenosine tetraphosphate (Ap4A) HIT family hydrolase
MCPFCLIANSSPLAVHAEDVVIAESTSFFAKPGLGQFAEGYTLVCSREHITNMASLTPEQLDELAGFTETMRERLTAMTGGRVIIFEHGTCSDTHAGSCVDHAHLHLVPLPESVDPSLVLPFPFVSIARYAQLTQLHTGNRAYLYVDDGSEMPRAYLLPSSLPSQYGRRIYCERLGLPDCWDWGVFPFVDRIEQMLSIYRRFSEINGWGRTVGGLETNRLLQWRSDDHAQPSHHI